MGLRATARFVLQSVTVGLAAAIVLLFLLPRFGPRPVVELTQAPTPPATAVVGRPGPATYADAVGAARPAVVNIYSGRTVVERPNPLTDDPVFRHFFGERQGPATRRQVTSLGSGVLISPQGYLLTNHHVIAGAEEVRVMLFDGRHAPAAVVGADPETDLAVLKVALEGLPAIALGNSDGLQVGDVVLAIGNPFGVGLTVTMGIVSATGRSDLGLSTYENFIQTDAAINPGNSGGALVDAFGNLVGVNTAIFTESGGSQGIGFAIPVNLAREVVTEIIAHGRVSRGWLGVEVQDLTPEIAESLRVSDDRGVVVRGVLRQGPAQVAGIQPGDVITAVGSQRVDTQQQLLQTVARARPGTRLPVEVMREGRPVAVEVSVAERPANAGQR